MKLSPTMSACQNFMLEHGRKITRLPGGFWVAPGSTEHHPSFGTTTVEALVTRGVAEYSDWKENRRGRFPIEATLLDHVHARDCAYVVTDGPAPCTCQPLPGKWDACDD